MHSREWTSKTSEYGTRNGLRWSNSARGAQLAHCSCYSSCYSSLLQHQNTRGMVSCGVYSSGAKKMTLEYQNLNKSSRRPNGEEQYFETKPFFGALGKQASNVNPTRAQRATSRTFGRFRFLPGATYFLSNERTAVDNECPTAGNNECSGNQKQTQIARNATSSEGDRAPLCRIDRTKAHPQGVSNSIIPPLRERVATRSPPPPIAAPLLLCQRVTFLVSSIVRAENKTIGRSTFWSGVFHKSISDKPPPPCVFELARAHTKWIAFEAETEKTGTGQGAETANIAVEEEEINGAIGMERKVPTMTATTTAAI